MSKVSYENALRDARAEMVELLGKRAQIDSRLTQLKSTIDVLSKLVEEAPRIDEEALADTLDSVGISTAIRQILTEAGVGLTPVQIKNKLGESGFDVSQYANAGAVIYNTLKRLERQEEVVPVNTSSGGPAYAMNPTFLARNMGAQEYLAKLMRKSLGAE